MYVRVCVSYKIYNIYVLDSGEWCDVMVKLIDSLIVYVCKIVRKMKKNKE